MNRFDPTLFVIEDLLPQSMEQSVYLIHGISLVSKSKLIYNILEILGYSYS